MRILLSGQILSPKWSSYCTYVVGEGQMQAAQALVVFLVIGKIDIQTALGLPAFLAGEKQLEIPSALGLLRV